MLLIIISALLLGCASADDAQWINVKGGVKGRPQGWGSYPYYNPGHTNNTQQGPYGSYVMHYNTTQQQNGYQGFGVHGQPHEVGVCYIEVP